MTAEYLQQIMEEACRAKPWIPECFEVVRVLQAAPLNNGAVHLVRSHHHDQAMIAVKKMPTTWVTVSPGVFRQAHPNALEQPWVDIGIVNYLYCQGCDHVCKPLGVFRDEAYTYVAASLATKGDLFAWCSSLGSPKRSNEYAVRPVARQILAAVRDIHDLGIAHRDLSLENILLTETHGVLRVQIIDFGMATLQRACLNEVRGKRQYQAPETHGAEPYDPFLADVFALGVVLYGMAAQDYPWVSTQPGRCRLFESIRAHGLPSFLQRRRVRGGKGEKLAQVLSEPLIDLVDGLLRLNLEARLTLGEACWSGRRSVWELSWLGSEPLAGEGSELALLGSGVTHIAIGS